jgi:hypothetical protein
MKQFKYNIAQRIIFMLGYLDSNMIIYYKGLILGHYIKEPGRLITKMIAKIRIYTI